MRRAHNYVVRPALALAVILAMSACGAPSRDAAPAPAATIVEDELSLEVSALM